MTSGPLPDPHARRRNAPTIPTTDLPAGGRVGRVPPLPRRIRLGPAGKAWWRWAWRTPQAAAWDGGGFLELIARRAGLEDDLAALERPAPPGDVGGFDPLFAKIAAALVAARTPVLREARELDDRLGLSPKGLAALRWRIVPLADVEAAGVADDLEARRQERWARAVAETPAPARRRKPST